MALHDTWKAKKMCSENMRNDWCVIHAPFGETRLKTLYRYDVGSISKWTMLKLSPFCLHTESPFIFRQKSSRWCVWLLVFDGAITPLNPAASAAPTSLCLKGPLGHLFELHFFSLLHFCSSVHSNCSSLQQNIIFFNLWLFTARKWHV